jgi:hypothetical protein
MCEFRSKDAHHGAGTAMAARVCRVLLFMPCGFPTASRGLARSAACAPLADVMRRAALSSGPL